MSTKEEIEKILEDLVIDDHPGDITDLENELKRKKQ